MGLTLVYFLFSMFFFLKSNYSLFVAQICLALFRLRTWKFLLRPDIVANNRYFVCCVEEANRLEKSQMEKAPIL